MQYKCAQLGLTTPAGFLQQLGSWGCHLYPAGPLAWQASGSALGGCPCMQCTDAQLAYRLVYPQWSCMTDGGTGTTEVVSHALRRWSLDSVRSSRSRLLLCHSWAAMGLCLGLAVFDACTQLCVFMQLLSFPACSPCRMLPSSPLLSCCCVRCLNIEQICHISHKHG
jgi:hypothetical protein